MSCDCFFCLIVTSLSRTDKSAVSQSPVKIYSGIPKDTTAWSEEQAISLQSCPLLSAYNLFFFGSVGLAKEIGKGTEQNDQESECQGPGRILWSCYQTLILLYPVWRHSHVLTAWYSGINQEAKGIRGKNDWIPLFIELSMWLLKSPVGMSSFGDDIT